jgi:hypothetical protein
MLQKDQHLMIDATAHFDVETCAYSMVSDI